MEQLLFVYGTLKRGDVRGSALAGQRFVSVALTLPRYRLFDCGDYPALIAATGGGSGREISGELWAVDAPCLQRLDAVEGVDEHLYCRSTIALAPPHADAVVEAYFYLRSVTGLIELDGRWTAKRR